MSVRMLIVDAVQNAKAGHPGMALGMAEVGYHLCRHVMRYNPKNPKWFNRDRFVLSAGHGCLLQYACLHLAGIQSVQTNCSYFFMTGPLGQGVANAVDFALAEAHLSARFNKPDAVVVDHRTNPAFSPFQVKTLIGKLSRKEGTSKAHHGTFDEDDYQSMKEKVKWNDREPFHVWPMSDAVDATRGYSEKCLSHLVKVLPGLIGGSADLASSNKVYLKGYKDFQSHSPEGRNIRYGVREHAMAAISNGIAWHGSGLIPFAATFLVFSDYMKNAMRLSALSHAGVVYVMTHDSIGLGEDGPTHQPVEHLCGLRAIPWMLVFRPADGNETAGAYRVAIRNREAPSVIALSRQKVLANLEGTSSDGVEASGYIVSDNSGDGGLPEIILIGTGSELCLCEASAEELRNEGWGVRVVSLVCWRLFDAQSKGLET
ncbi:hypothetical protein QJS10_CPA09g01770 [Acorus calamus]|uniref:transketolase n=1 Tax=Acorus calamus TaxID=4465 RepID=A0AAV9E3Y3_ACOCL|nr:hypothetical protein QJS10_CPA09g01770 [Acorus calamus]